MGAIGIIGMVAAIAVLILLCYKGVNGFIASLAAAIILVVTNGMPFWETMTGTYCATMGGTIGSYIFFFCIGSALGELMKISGTAETVSNRLFNLIGAKMAVIATLLISFLLAYCGINVFIIIFVLYPLAVPMFKKANISKNLMPGIFLYGAVVLMVATPGNPSALNLALSNALGTTSFSAPIMSIIVLIIAFIIGIAYLVFAAKHSRDKGDGFVATGKDSDYLAGELTGKELPSLLNSILPLLAIFVLKFVLVKYMSATFAIYTALLAGIVLLIALNYKYLKGKLLKGFTDGWWSSINSLVLMASLMGFAAVVNGSDAFQHFINFALVMADKFNPYISSLVCVNIFSAITGASLSGTQIFCNTLMEYFLGLGINPSALSKVIALGAMGLDTLPHCPTFIMMAAICGVTTKASYKHVFVLTVVTPIVLAAIACVLAMVGIV